MISLHRKIKNKTTIVVDSKEMLNGGIQYIDLAKGFCILMVVYYHCVTAMKIELPFNDMLASFRMPFYFCYQDYFLSPIIHSVNSS